ncbi:MAG: hypothetical protein K2Z81_07230, partial [Cyanobacteria bacterium]|nr:hypothetical protein [Cyanobacteriota bacterium]
NASLSASSIPGASGGSSYPSSTSGTTSNPAIAQIDTSPTSDPNRTLLASVSRSKFMDSPSSTPGESSLSASAVVQATSGSIPRGTEFDVMLIDPLDSNTTRVGNNIVGTLAKPIMLNAREGIKAGSIVSGKVHHACPSGREIEGEVTIWFSSIKLSDGTTYKIKATCELKSPEALKRKLSGAATKATIGAGVYTGLRFIGVPGISTIGALVGHPAKMGMPVSLVAGSTVKAKLDKSIELEEGRKK